MSQTPQTPYAADDPDARATELRELAGPVHGEGGPEGDDPRDGDATPGGTVTDSPDALTDPDVDEVRADSDDGAVGDLEDQYELRSMPAQPNPTEDDPGSHLNF